ncbi:MAG: DUF1254 domain-containing protein [Erythrobacter sp.]
MKNFIGPILFALLIAVIGHVSVLHFAPNIIMDRAMTMLERRGAELHTFFHGERTTPQSQSVVRPSPDLAYSVCLFDLEQLDAGLEVRMAATPNYASLSFFDDQTNNFKTIRGNGEEITVTLASPDTTISDAETIVSPSRKGLILIRRLAPTAEDFRLVSAISQNDFCRPVDR